MARQTIAIVGGGGAGTTAAWLLDKVHDVTLFEAQPRLGGHAYTHHMNVAGRDVHVDMGVEYFNERLSPNLFAIHRLFGVETYVAPLSFRTVFPGADNAWSNVTGKGRLRQTLGAELDLFHLDMTRVLHAGDPAHKKSSIGEFLRQRGYSEAFKQQALLPLMTTFSGCNAPSLDYNLMYVAISFNMSLLSFYAPGYWRKARGGIDSYIRAIERSFRGTIRLGTPVASVRSLAGGGIALATPSGDETFDQVVFATHADVTLKLIHRPTPLHRDILGRFEYVPVRSVMHSDAGVLAAGGDGEYCEFSLGAHVAAEDGRPRYGQLTRINNRLPPYAGISEPLLVTFDARQPIDAGKIAAEQHWKLPKLRPCDFYQKTRYRLIQGDGDMWYCGTDTSLTGHEGAVVSGMVVAERLGATYPFADNDLAVLQCNVIKDIMGVGTPAERWRAALGDAFFGIAKRFSIHKTQSHRFIRDIIV